MKIDIVPELNVKVRVQPVSGDLRVVGWERDEVKAEPDEHLTIQLDEASGEVTVDSRGDLRLMRVPSRASLTVEQIAGDARITGLEGEIELNNISGDLVLRDVGPVQLNNIAADLRVRGVTGALEVGHVGADATVRGIEGDVHISSVGADLFIGDVQGSCVVDHVGSDLVLNTPFLPDNQYKFNVGADVVCQVEADSSVQFMVRAGASVEVEADDAVETESEDGHYKVIAFGNGEALVEIQAGSEVRLVRQSDEKGFTFDIDLDLDWPFKIDERLVESLSSIEETLSDKLSDLSQRLNITIARQTEKAQKQADKIRRQAEKRAARLQRAAERQAREIKIRTWAGEPPEPPHRRHLPATPRPPAPPAPPAPAPPEPVSDEERLMILRMLERGQISVEEAERLLVALEGRSK